MRKGENVVNYLYVTGEKIVRPCKKSLIFRSKFGILYENTRERGFCNGNG